MRRRPYVTPILLAAAVAAGAPDVGKAIRANLLRSRALASYFRGVPVALPHVPSAAWIAGLAAFDRADIAAALDWWRLDAERCAGRLTNLGLRDWRFGGRARAVAALTSAVDLTPEAAAPIATLVSWKLSMGRSASAFDDVNGVLARAPRNAVALALRGWMRADMQHAPAEGLVDVREALVIAPEEPTVLQYSAQVLAVAGASDQEIEPLLVRGNRVATETDIFAYELLKLYTRQQRFAEGEPLVHGLQVSRASDAFAREWVGFFYTAQQRHELALREFETAASLEPGEARFQLEAGDAARALGRGAVARRAYEAALRLGDSSAAARLSTLASDNSPTR